MPGLHATRSGGHSTSPEFVLLQHHNCLSVLPPRRHLRYREEGQAAKRKELAAEGGGRAAKKARKAARE
jgi:hypothetical protein